MGHARKAVWALLALAAVLVTGCGAQRSESPLSQACQEAARGETGESGGAPLPDITLPERIRQAGKIVIGMDTTYPPMEFVCDDGRTYVGFDVDLARALAAKMGVEVEFVSVNWDGIVPGLLSGRYDAILSSMTITEERLKEIDFVEYAQMAQVFVTRKDRPPIRTEKDLAGRVIAVQAETTSQYWVEKLPPEYQPKELRKFVDNNAVYLEIQTGRADGAVTDEPVGRYFASYYKDVMEVTGLAVDPEPVGIGIRKDDPELKAAFEKALAALKADGTLDRLMQKWFGGELGKPAQ